MAIHIISKGIPTLLNAYLSNIFLLDRSVRGLPNDAMLLERLTLLSCSM